MKRLQQRDEIELRWYFEGGSLIGVRSGFGNQLELARAGQLFDQGNHTGGADMEGQIASVRRAKRVRDKLRSMGPRSANAIVAAYCWDKMLPLAWIGLLGGVCLLTATARRSYDRAAKRDIAKARGDRVDGWLDNPLPTHQTMSRWLGPKLTKELEFRATVLSEADAMLGKACQKWYDRAGN